MHPTPLVAKHEDAQDPKQSDPGKKTSKDAPARIVPGENLPEMARDLEVLGNLTRLKVLLKINEYSPIYFTDLSTSLSLDKNILAYHLAILGSVNFIKQELQQRAGRKFSTYSLTDKARMYLTKFAQIE